MYYSALLQPTSIWLFLVLPVMFLLGLLVRSSRRKLTYPPGPKGLPIIGNMNMIDQLTHRGLAKLANQYGGLLHLRLGFLHMVVVSTPYMARQVLQVQDNIFSNRPSNIAIRYLTYDLADMVFAPYGRFLRQMRKICVTRLFSRKRAESWASVRDQVESMIHTVESRAGGPVNIGNLAFSLAMNITYRAAFGSDILEGPEKFVSIMREFSKLFGAFNWADFFPWLGWFDPQGLNQRLVKARKSLDVFIDKIIDEHITKRKSCRSPSDDPDMVDDLLAFYGEEAKKRCESDDLKGAIILTRDNIKAIIMDVMFGGIETVASVIEWAMAELMKSPDDLKRVQQEMEDVVGLKRNLQEKDIEKLNYFRCAVKETLRLHPPVPLLLHETAQDTEVGGYAIPKGARVVINAWAIGRDKDSWDEPETFKPSRFLKEGAPDFKGCNFEFVPFGSGRRSCPGMQLAMYAIELAVSHLLHCFRWELPDGMKPNEIDMSDVYGLTVPRAVRLVAVPTPRLTCRLLNSDPVVAPISE